MKPNKYIINLMLLILSSALWSQDRVKDSTLQYEENNYPTLNVELDASPDFIKEEWKDFVKEKYDVKLKGYGFLANQNTLTAQEEIFKGLDEKRADMYFYVEALENDRSEVHLFMTFGYDVKVSATTYPNIYEQLKADFKNFLNQKMPEYFQNSMATIGDELKDLERDLGRTNKQIEKAKKKSDRAKKTIEENKVEIEELETDREELSQEISEEEKRKKELMQSIEAKKKLLELKRKKLKQIKF